MRRSATCGPTRTAGPLAFTERILGRAFVGHDKSLGAFAKHGHQAALMGTLLVAGYMALTLNDVRKGRWPPRDPTDAKTILAALMVGGGAGIYGDFLFGEANRFGNSPLETAAGPIISTAANLVEAYQRAIRGEGSGAEILNIVLNNTPFANLWWTRPVMDTLFLNNVREWSSPGYQQRQADRLERDYGQENFLPQ